MGHFVVSELVEIYMLREVFLEARSGLHYGHMVILTNSFWRLFLDVSSGERWMENFMDGVSSD